MDYLLISSVYLLLETFFLISLRILGFFLVVPVFGGQSMPNTVKISISMASALILLTSQSVPLYQGRGLSFAMFFAIGIKELAVGLIMGFSVYFLVSVFYYIGQLVDFQIGFSMVQVMDPLTQTQIPLSGNLFYLTVAFLLLVAGAHYNFFRALFYSYTVIPIGQATLTSNSLLQTGLNLFGTFFSFGFRTALPIVGTILVLEIALGILNKAAPQMHIFSVGMTLKIIVGLVILYVIYPMFLTVTNEVVREINRTLYMIINGMTP